MKKPEVVTGLLLTLSMAGGIMCGSEAAFAGTEAHSSVHHGASRGDRNAQTRRSRVIVRFTSELTNAQKAQLKMLGAEIYNDLSIIKSAALSIPTQNMENLGKLSFVQHISPDLDVKKADEFTVESSGADIAYTQSHLDATGIVVAVIDSGIHKVSDNNNRVIAGVNFVPGSDGKVNAGDTDDHCGHGTHVAGIICGNGLSSTGKPYYRTFVGIARGASVVPIRVLDANGQGTVSQVISGIQWAVKNKATLKIKIINLSLGHPVGESYTTDPLCQAVESAWKAGIVVVCSAGNSGRLQNTVDPTLDNEGYGAAYGSIQSPGNDPYVITVGAMKAMDFKFYTNGTHTHSKLLDKIATYSSRGPSRLDLVLKPDIVAPGNRIISLEAAKSSTLISADANTNEVLQNEYVVTNNLTATSDRYFRLSGTSMAAPVVAGAAALMLQKAPGLSPDIIKARLMLSADKWLRPDFLADPLTYGAGYINIPAALACTASPTQPALSPSLTMDADGDVSVVMDRAVWGSAVDGSRAVWGMTGVSDLRAVWGMFSIAWNSDSQLAASRAIWGHSVDAERAIWGHSVWEDRAVWGMAADGVDLTSVVIKGE